ncbi:MAG: SDR family oxidoreductase [Saprospiraceae bacterium]|nr:SDR family oxidoreductase [Saprospiraceae bacterium]
MPFRLDNKTALITGGGSGIGASISWVFAEAGANVYILDLSEEKAALMAQSIRNNGGKAHHYQTDVTQQKALVELVSKIATEVGSIDILVNSAGVAHIGKLDTTSEADFDKIYEVNIKGVYNSMYAVITHMMQQKSGIILNIASTASLIGLPDRFAYSMSKGAVLTMTYTVARDYLEYNIRCNAVAPARIHTPFVDNFIAKNYPGKEQEMFEKLSKTQPIGRMGKPEEVAYLVLYLCSDEASFITGTNFPIDGGFLNLNT